ncbi:MAG TPA: WD40 repeat domain-containing protein, partial [Cytophagaceae bacterium]
MVRTVQEREIAFDTRYGNIINLMNPVYYLVFLLVNISIYSSAQYHVETVIQKGHNGAIKSIATSADGRYVVTGSRDKSAKLWDLNTRRELRTFFGHSYTVNSVQLSSDGKFLATTSSDKTAKVWSVLTGKELYSTLPAEKFMTDVAFSPDAKLFICGGYGDSATIYKVDTWEKVKTLAVNSDQGSGVGTNFSFSPDGKWLAVGEDNRTSKIYTTSNWELSKVLAPAEGWCGGCGTFVCFSPDSRYLLKVSSNSKPERYEVISGKLVNTYNKIVEEATSSAYSPDGRTVLASTKSSIYLWDETTENAKDSLKDIPAFNEVVFNSDGKSLVTANDNNTASVIRVSDHGVEAILTGILNDTDKGGINYDRDSYWDSYIAEYIGLKNNLLISPDGKSFIKGKSGTKARKWDIVTGAPVYDYQGHEKAVICFDYSQDGKLLVTGDGAGTAILWDVESKKIIRRISHHTQPIFDIKFSPDGLSIISCSWDATVNICETTTGKSISKIDLQTYQKYSVYSISPTPDGLYLIMGNLNKSLEMWEPDSKSVVRTFIGHTDVVSSISFSPDKKHMLTSSWDGTARLWDMPSGLMVNKYVGSNGGLNISLFSPDGKKVITGGADRVIRIYEKATGKLISTLQGHQAGISSISLSPDGKTLISASLDEVIKIWDFEKGIEFYEHIHIGTKDWMAKTKDGYFNATEGARSSIHFVRGMESFSANQFFEKFYRPELLPQLFRKRVDKNLQGINETINMFPPPTCKIATLPMEGGLQASVFVKLINEGGGIEDIKLLHNGKRIQLNSRGALPDTKKGEEIIYIDTLDLVGGTNVFTVSAYSDKRIESSPTETKVFSDRKEKNATCHILAIGVDKYKNSALTLNFAKADAEAIVNSFS